MTTPKQRFLQSDTRVKAWNQIVEAPPFQEALDAAMLEFIGEARMGAVYEAQAAAHRLEGAARFMVILSNLAVRNEPKRRSDLESLEYERATQQAGLKPQSESLEQL